MLVRLVKMAFKPEKTEEFEQLFDKKKELIRAFDGCLHLELWRNAHQPNIYHTYSMWQSEAHLESYRRSELFRNTWKHTKTLFAAPPEADSLERLRLLP